MDIEKLIERLKQKDGLWCSVPTGENLIAEAATALSTLQAENEKLHDLWSDASIRLEDELDENEKLRAELEKVKRALAMMWFAYVNSDKETPYSYETEALEEAERILGPWAECMPKYLRRGPQKED